MSKKLLGIDLGGTTVKFGILQMVKFKKNGLLKQIRLKMVATLFLTL